LRDGRGATGREPGPGPLDQKGRRVLNGFERGARGAALASLIALTACGAEPLAEPQAVVFEVIEEVTFDPALGIDLSTMVKLPSGVYFEDRIEGTGQSLEWGHTADLNYTGWLRTGLVFDQGTFSFLMGNNVVIPGFEQGMLGMKVGGTRLIIIPPILAYGERGAGAIPPGAIVIFEVELLGAS